MIQEGSFYIFNNNIVRVTMVTCMIFNTIYDNTVINIMYEFCNNSNSAHSIAMPMSSSHLFHPVDIASIEDAIRRYPEYFI